MLKVPVPSRALRQKDPHGANEMTKKPAVEIAIDPAPKRELKALGGGDRDQWNERLVNLVTGALPVNQKNIEAVSHAGSAAMAGVVDMNPSDQIEGMLISQLVVANEAALTPYRRAWACDPADYFEAHTKNLQLADKASRTVALLSERLHHHRGRGQQHITVKHVTVNADQALVTDQIVSGKDAGLLTSGTEKSMENLEPSHKDLEPSHKEAVPAIAKDHRKSG